MNNFELSPPLNEEFDFGLNFDFDISAAFEGATHDVASDTELALDEKVRRMEVIVTEASSETYREYVDFRRMAADIEMFCQHNHELSQAAGQSETLTGFFDQFGSDHDHDHHDGDEVDPATGKKKKKKKTPSFLHLLVE